MEAGRIPPKDLLRECCPADTDRHFGLAPGLQSVEYYLSVVILAAAEDKYGCNPRPPKAQFKELLNDSDGQAGWETE